MATKKAPAKTTAAPAAKKMASAPAKKTVTTKKMTKTELVRLVAEKMEIPTKQAAAFFDLLEPVMNFDRVRELNFLEK